MGPLVAGEDPQQLDPAPGSGFAENIVHVGTDGGEGDEELVGDLAVAESEAD